MSSIIDVPVQISIPWVTTKSSTFEEVADFAVDVGSMPQGVHVENKADTEDRIAFVKQEIEPELQNESV